MDAAPISAAGLAVGTLGLLVSLCGFAVAITQIKRARSAAEAAAQAARDARQTMMRVASVSDLSQIVIQIDLLKEMYSAQDFGRAVDRCILLRRLLTDVMARLPDPEHRAVLYNAIMQLQRLEVAANGASDEQTPVSSERFISVLVAMQQALDEVRAKIELEASDARSEEP